MILFCFFKRIKTIKNQNFGAVESGKSQKFSLTFSSTTLKIGTCPAISRAFLDLRNSLSGRGLRYLQVDPNQLELQEYQPAIQRSQAQ